MVDHYEYPAFARDVVQIFPRNSGLDSESLEQPSDQRAVRMRLLQLFIDRRDLPKAQNPFDNSRNRPRHRCRDEAE